VPKPIRAQVVGSGTTSAKVVPTRKLSIVIFPEAVACLNPKPLIEVEIAPGVVEMEVLFSSTGATHKLTKSLEAS
jgi:hypothetical protein